MASNGEPIALFAVFIVAILMAGGLAVGLVLVVRDTIRRRGNWGINAKQVYCPLCGQPAPGARVPKNWRQALWGGCTCADCGLEYDKWGRAVDEDERQRRLNELDVNPYSRFGPSAATAEDRVRAPGTVSKEKRDDA
jgi:hypothetical protein